MTRAALLAATLLALALATPAAAAPALVSLGSFSTPTFAAAPAGEPTRVFVTEKGGRVRLILDGVVQPTPFLDLTSSTQSSDSERGLLSIAFAPDYAASGKFYVYLTARTPLGEIQVWEYERSASDPNAADPGSGRLLIGIPHTQAANHNGGTVQVGPDGKVWLATGDGGGGDNTFGNAQNPNTRLGKLLRLDPAAPAGVEQLAQGLRNPFRFSFAPDGTIVIADVGQNAWEEINVGLAANYGWPCREGARDYHPNDPGCDGIAAADPVVEKSHNPDGFCAIVGGVVVRDPGLPTLNGRYIYGDNCNTALRSVNLSAPGTDAATGMTVSRLAGIGEDACGRVLVVSLNGTVSRIADGQATPCGVDPTPTPTATPTATATVEPTATPTTTPAATPTADPTEVPPHPTPTPTPSPEPMATAFAAPPPFVAPPLPDLRPCTISTRVTGLRSLTRRGYLSVALRTDEACRATLTARGFRTVATQLVAGARVVVKLRRTTSRARSIAVTIEARDGAGNLRRLSQTVRAR